MFKLILKINMFKRLLLPCASAYRSYNGRKLSVTGGHNNLSGHICMEKNICSYEVLVISSRHVPPCVHCLCKNSMVTGQEL